MDDALSADELITLAFVKPDWKSDFVDRPAIAVTVCVGKILSHTKLEDGRYNLFLVGAKRAKIVKELDPETPYRMAEVEIMQDTVDGSSDMQALRGEIVNLFRELAEIRTSWNHEALDQFLDDALPFGQLVDMICYSCGASPGDQQKVLEAMELGHRGRIVLRLLREQLNSKQRESTGSSYDFPPGFSLN